MKNEKRQPIVITPEILLIAAFHEKCPEIKVEGTSLISKIKNYNANKTRIKVPVNFVDVYFLGKYIGYANRETKICSRIEVKDILKTIRKSGLYEKTENHLIYTTLSRSAVAEKYNAFPEELKTAIKRARTLERAAKIVEAKRKLKAAQNTTEAPTTLKNEPTVKTQVVNNDVDRTL